MVYLNIKNMFILLQSDRPLSIIASILSLNYIIIPSYKVFINSLV